MQIFIFCKIPEVLLASCNHTILTEALLADFVEDTEELWRYRGQRLQLHLLEILWAVFLQVAISLAQAAHDHVGLRAMGRVQTQVTHGSFATVSCPI